MKKHMTEALLLAKKAGERGEIPVGAVIVRNGEIIATGMNRRETDKTALGHAEIEAIDSACRKLGRWRLDDCELYVTLEPCPMCAGAIINARLKKVIFGAFDKKAGSFGSIADFNSFGYNHTPNVQGGIMEEECSQLMSDFFKQLRLNKKEQKKNKNEE